MTGYHVSIDNSIDYVKSTNSVARYGRKSVLLSAVEVEWLHVTKTPKNLKLLSRDFAILVDTLTLMLNAQNVYCGDLFIS